MPDLPLSQWRPRARLVVDEHRVDRPAYEAIDVHNHVGRWLSPTDDWMVEDRSALLRVLDDVGVQTVVNLDGRWGGELRANVDRYDRAVPGRFSTFCHLDWSALSEPAGAADTAAVDRLGGQLERAQRAGAVGVKIWKDLGLHVRDGGGELVRPDDARVVGAVRTAGDLDLPVLIHTADPVAFFDPVDEHNERIEELTIDPQLWFGADGYPTFDELMDATYRLVEACPGTTFIGAHVGCHAEDLGAVGRALTRLPNWNVDTGGRLAEVGRQPRAFRRLVESFPDRVLFGSDCFPPDRDTYRRWWRFLETDDEHFGYVADDELPFQGRWRISGVALSDGLLRAVYRENAQRLLRLG